MSTSTSPSRPTDPGTISSAAAPAASGAAESSSASTTEGADCADLAQVTTAIAGTVDELSLLVGTEKDASAILADVDGFAPALGGLVPTCAPAAEESMWAFLTAVAEMRQQFSAGKGATEMGWSKLALIQVRAAGAEFYRQLGLEDRDWLEVRESARPGCRDLEPISARMTWDVRHLANLIGSDNVTNARGYLVQIGGLTSAIEALVVDCRPRASVAMARFREAVDHLATAYQAGTNPAVVEADKAAFGDLRASGISLYSQLGLDVSSWEVIPTNER